MNQREAGLTEGQLLALWEEARRKARVWCGSTLARLRRGEGGFYQEEDFWQDLFVEFWDLAEAWWPTEDDLDELWALWRKRLWLDGWRVIRRAPQRLWRRPERAIDPDALELERGPDDEAAQGVRLPETAVAALLYDPDGPRALMGAGQVEAAERALWALPLGQRQALYMTVVAGMPAAEVARCLGLPRRALVYHWVRTARRRLGAMEGQGDGSG